MSEQKYHTVVRTNPKGVPFRGRCIQCGLTNLPAEAARWPCENWRGLTQEQSVLEAITGKPSDE